MVTFREERLVRRKQDIEKTALRIFKEKGYNDTTIEEIANELKYTKSSIYYYIPKKEYLLFLLHQNYTKLMLNKAKPIACSELSSEQKLRELIFNHVAIVIDEMSVLTTILQHEHDLEEKHREQIFELRHEYEEFFMDVLKEGIKKGVFRCNNMSMVKMAIFGAINWIPHWYKKSGSRTKEEIGTFLSDFLVSSLLLKQK